MKTTTYSSGQIETLASRRWERLIAANGGVCELYGWHLEVTSAGATLLLEYADRDGKVRVERVEL